ncbi:MAG: geranylgeranylglycerol-phosphate geranylgeranyltransferase [Bacteroidales bacterium]|jgi:4-hydroxybenzoate polyprenyltransferase|nr:geranylgeranylglycerol-phosphate geranylgeranyltransferase [Bacteroidales bacterium]
MKELLRVIRWKNLLIVIATMVMIRYLLLGSLVSQMTVLSLTGESMMVELQFPWYNFLALVFATVCLTAGGYVINDYFDIKTDLINRGNVIVGTVIPRRKAMMLHNILNLAGVVAGFYVSWSVGYFWFGTIFLLVSGLLWFYSASYKRQFLIGNLIVSMLTALVPFIVAVFEFPPMYGYYSNNAADHPYYKLLFFWAGGFALFAFLTTLVREIIKDIEDYEGDREYGRNTLPIVVGIKGSKTIVTALIFSVIITLYVVWVLFVSDKLTFVYITVALVSPMLLATYMVLTGRGKRHFHEASTVMKIVMLAGIVYTAVVKLILTARIF